MSRQLKARASKGSKARTTRREARIESQDEERFFVIEKLLKKRYNKEGFEEYLVRWQHYSPEWDSWEPRQELEKNSRDLILEFNGINGNEFQGDELHCICRRPYRRENGGMIQCNACSTWFHFSCLKMSMEEANLYHRYYCDQCQHANSSLTNKVKLEKYVTDMDKMLIENLFENKTWDLQKV